VRRLVLWDIDGTLVDTAGYGRDAFLAAFEEVVGRPPGSEPTPMAGRTDHDIALGLLELEGVVEGERQLDAFTAALARALAAREPEIRARGQVKPGVPETLEALASRPGVVQSLLTGNIEPNAVVKLAAFGLERWFDFGSGAYGSDHRIRAELVGIARAKAGERHGISFAAEETVLVGDTPLDVAAGREGGARVVAVATGPYGVSELRAAGADVVLPDLRDTDAALAAILGDATPR
jgi:phosphoglycolate phosphatase